MSNTFVNPPPRTDPNARKHVDPVNLVAKIESDPKRSMPVRTEHWFPEDSIERGYSEMELRIALEAVRDPENWKMPVEANFPTLTDAERDLIHTALIYYCGSHTEFIHPHSGGITAVAAGYYNCIGA
jgi:hypothetical protein